MGVWKAEHPHAPRVAPSVCYYCWKLGYNHMAEEMTGLWLRQAKHKVGHGGDHKSCEVMTSN